MLQGFKGPWIMLGIVLQWTTWALFEDKDNFLMKFNWNFLIIPLKLLNYLELKPCENHLTSKSGGKAATDRGPGNLGLWDQGPEPYAI